MKDLQENPPLYKTRAPWEAGLFPWRKVRPFWRPLLIAFLAMGLALLASPPEAYGQAGPEGWSDIAGPDDEYEAMITGLETLAEDNASMVQGWALTLFGLMATLEIILVGMSGLLGMTGLDEMIGRLFKRLVLFSVLATAITSYNAWFPPIMDTFQELGRETTGFDETTTVGDVLKIGWNLMQATHKAGKDFIQSADSWYTAAIGWYFSTPYLTALFIGIAFWATFGLLSLQFFYVQMEAAIATYIGMIVLGFSAFRGTAMLAENYVGYLLRVGIKLFLIYFLIGLFEPVAAGWVDYLSPGPSSPLTAGQIINRSIKVFIGAVLFAGVALSLPSFASRKITEGFSLGLSKTLSK